MSWGHCVSKVCGLRFVYIMSMLAPVYLCDTKRAALSICGDVFLAPVPMVASLMSSLSVSSLRKYLLMTHSVCHGCIRPALGLASGHCLVSVLREIAAQRILRIPSTMNAQQSIPFCVLMYRNANNMAQTQ